MVMSRCVCTSGMRAGCAGFTGYICIRVTAVCFRITRFTYSITLARSAVRLQPLTYSMEMYEPEANGTKPMIHSAAATKLLTQSYHYLTK